MTNTLIAPNGKPSNLNAEQYALVRTPAFKKWFGDWENDPENSSKIVDDNGEPIVVYHTTDNDFTIFNDGIIFFSKDIISRFGKKVLKCFLSIKNPYTLNDAQSWQNIGLSYSDLRWEDMLNDLSELQPIYIEDVCDWAKKEKYEGVIAKNIGETEDSSIMTDDYIAFKSNQIKLADGSNTTFDASSPDIRYADGGAAGEEITCVNCGWHWNTSDSDESDKYVCHKCGFDNKAFYDPEPIGFMADGGTAGITKIAEDVYISRDKNKLPKDATIVMHRYDDNIKAGELGLFAGYLEGMEFDSGYGENKAYISIGKNAKVKKIGSTENYLRDLGELDKPRKYLKKKYGYNSLEDLMDDAGNLENPSDAWYERQKVALNIMREAGEDFEVLEMLYEEDYIPHQYLITTLKNKEISFSDGGLIDLIEGVRLDENIYEDNIEYHSAYSKINSNADAEKILKENFIQSFKNNVQIDKDGNVNAYRLLMLDDISDLDTNNLGIYWAYSEDKVVIADDEGYEHEKKSYENKYIIKVKANIKNINWQDTFDLYVMNDWMEGEIRFVKNTKPSQTYYKKLGDSKWIKLKGNDISFADGGLIAPNGNPSNLTAEQYDLVRTPAFKKWFGDWENDPENASKVVDKNGEPLVVYRGSIDELGKHGFEFKLGLNLLNKKNANNFGFFFTDDIDAANKYRLKYFDDIIGSVNSFFLNERKILDLTVLGLQTSQQTFVDTLIEKEIKFDGFEYLPNHILNYFEVNEYMGWGAYTFDYFDVFPELRDLFIANGYNGIIFWESSRKYSPYKVYVAFEPTQIKLADGTNTTFDAENPDVRYADGGTAGKSKVYYHGSNTLFKNIKFLESIYREDLYLGDGIYITNDINVAKKYGKYIYEIIIEEPLKSLKYSSAVSREDMIEIIDIFQNSDDSDLNYLATNYQDDLDDDDLLWGKQLIADLERNGVNVHKTLLDLGYNSIISPINKLNDFFGFDDNSMNINVIKKGILHIYSIQYEDGILENPLDTGMRKWEKKEGIVLRDKENQITLIAYNTENRETGTALYNTALIYKSVKHIRQANEIIEMLDNQLYEQFDESKIEGYKKSNRLIIMNQNEVVYDSEKPDLTYADGGLIAPNGKSSNLTEEQYRLVRTPEFKAWFGDWEKDKLNKYNRFDELTNLGVTKDGEPRIWYHARDVEYYEFERDTAYFAETSKYSQQYGHIVKPFFVKCSNTLNLEYVKKNKAYKFDGLCFMIEEAGGELKGEDYEILKKHYEDIKESGGEEYYLLWEFFTQYNRLHKHFENWLSKYFDSIYYWESGKPYGKGFRQGKILYIFGNVSQRVKLADGTNTTFDMNNPDIRYADGGLIYKKIYSKGGGGYTTVINGMEYSINKQYTKGTWVAQSADGEYYDEAKTLADIKYYLEKLKKDLDNSYADGGLITNDNIEVQGLNNYTKTKKSGKFYNLFGKRKVNNDGNEYWWVSFSRKDGINKLGYVRYRNENGQEKFISLNELPKSLIEIYNNPDIRYADGGLIDTTFYHGTGEKKKVIDAIKNNQFNFSKSGGYTSGMYITPFEELAKKYADLTDGKDKGVVKIKFKRKPKIKKYNDPMEEYEAEKKFSSYSIKESLKLYYKNLLEEGYDVIQSSEDVLRILPEKLEIIYVQDDDLMAKGGLSKTPAPKKDRVFGSDKNKVGSAASKESAKKINLSDGIITTLSIINSINKDLTNASSATTIIPNYCYMMPFTIIYGSIALNIVIAKANKINFT